jgi:acetyl/propionyl-CoA carboxylase alpha subunit
MIRAIQEYDIQGVATTLPFGLFVMQHPAFRSGNFDTGFIAQYDHESALNTRPSDEQLFSAAVAAALHQEQAAGTQHAVPASSLKSAPPMATEPSTTELNHHSGFAPWRINRGF